MAAGGGGDYVWGVVGVGVVVVLGGGEEVGC